MKNKGIEELKKMLQEKEINQIKASELSGVPQSTISRHLSGEREKIDPGIAIKYEKAFGIPKENFIFLDITNNAAA